MRQPSLVVTFYDDPFMYPNNDQNQPTDFPYFNVVSCVACVVERRSLSSSSIDPTDQAMSSAIRRLTVLPMRLPLARAVISKPKVERC